MIKPTLTLLAAFAAMGAIGYYTHGKPTPPRDNPAVFKPVIEPVAPFHIRSKACTDSGVSLEECGRRVNQSFHGEGLQHFKDIK